MGRKVVHIMIGWAIVLLVVVLVLEAFRPPKPDILEGFMVRVDVQPPDIENGWPFVVAFTAEIVARKGRVGFVTSTANGFVSVTLDPAGATYRIKNRHGEVTDIGRVNSNDEPLSASLAAKVAARIGVKRVGGERRLCKVPDELTSMPRRRHATV